MFQNINVGFRIRYFRQLRNWSQEKLALQAGINPAFLGHLERGLKSPTISTLEKIVSALEITFAEFFADETGISDLKKSEIQRIEYAVRDLDADSIAKIADIVQQIVELRG